MQDQKPQRLVDNQTQPLSPLKCVRPVRNGIKHMARWPVLVYQRMPGKLQLATALDTYVDAKTYPQYINTATTPYMHQLGAQFNEKVIPLAFCFVVNLNYIGNGLFELSQEQEGSYYLTVSDKYEIQKIYDLESIKDFFKCYAPTLPISTTTTPGNGHLMIHVYTSLTVYNEKGTFSAVGSIEFESTCNIQCGYIYIEPVYINEKNFLEDMLKMRVDAVRMARNKAVIIISSELTERMDKIKESGMKAYKNRCGESFCNPPSALLIECGENEELDLNGIVSPHTEHKNYFQEDYKTILRRGFGKSVVETQCLRDHEDIVMGLRVWELSIGEGLLVQME